MLERLQHLQHEKQTVEIREQQNTEQAKQWCEQVQQQADARIAQMAESNRQLRQEIHEGQKAAEGQVAYVARQAELDRDRAVKELQMLGAKLEAAHQKLKDSERMASMAGSIGGSPCVGNPFDHPLPHTQSAQHTEIMTVGPGASVASVNPLEVMFCSCCGSQNVVGRPSCWRCSTMFSAVVANNGADQNLLQGDRIGAASCPPPSLSPSEPFRFRGAGVAQAYPVVGSASIAAPTGILAPGGPMGGAGVGSGGAPSGIPVEGYCNFVQGGPRIQGGYIVPTARGTGREEVRSTMGGRIPSNPGVAEFAIHTPRSGSSSNGSSTSQGLIGDKSFQPPKDGWLPEGKSEEDVYKLKHLKSIVITRLPNDATSCREWRAAFLASISRIDLSQTDVLVKWATLAMEGRGKAFRNSLQTSKDFIMLNKHIAAELIKPEVLSTNVELAHEITSWVERCAARAEGPKGTPLLNLIISYYETGLDRAVALGQMHLLNLQLEGKEIKELEEFVKKVNYVLHGLKNADRPSPKTMFEWLWHQIKGLGILRRVTDKVRESSQRSKKRSFEWIWAQISEELRERRHDMNYENVVKGLRGTPPHQLALPATGEKPTRTTRPKKTAAVAQPATPGPVTTQGTKKFPCALHTAGFCRFGDRCRNQHQGDPGSDTARKAYSDFLKDNPKGGESSKGSGKQPGKGKNKSNGKGKKGDTKGNKGGATAPAAVAAAASTVTITEVEGKQVQKAWQSFCQFCDKALPSLNMFLKLSVPILATLISSITNSYDQIGEITAASMVHPAVQNFKKYSLEFLGDTGAAHDIGSLRALQDQGVSRDMVEPWMKALQSPVRFATGGGPQLSIACVHQGVG